MKMKHEPELFLSDARGIYIPKDFAECITRNMVTGITEEDYTVLEAGPDHAWYWDTWDSVMDNAILTTEDGATWRFWQDGDLWIVPDGYDNDDFFGGY